MGDFPGLTTFEPVRRVVRIPGMAAARRVRIGTERALPEITRENNEAAVPRPGQP